MNEKHNFSFLFSVTAMQTKFIVICSVLFVEGLCRGIVMVYYSLCVTNYCSQNQIPTAIGLYMFVQGIMSLIIGPLTGNYEIKVN